jgi:hypothetical protein
MTNTSGEGSMMSNLNTDAVSRPLATTHVTVVGNANSIGHGGAR